MFFKHVLLLRHISKIHRTATRVQITKITLQSDYVYSMAIGKGLSVVEQCERRTTNNTNNSADSIYQYMHATFKELKHYIYTYTACNGGLLSTIM